MNIISSMAAAGKRKRLAAGALFVVYLVVLGYFLFFSEELGRTYDEREYHYNLALFYEIRRFWRYRRVLGVWPVFLNLVGNVLAFLPFGMFLPIFVKGSKSFFKTVLYGFEFSLFVELMQLTSKVGCFDVDDLMLNTIGAAAGWMVYRYIGEKLMKHNKKEAE